jgi:hydroxyacylglutathione hydrolase
MEGTLMPGDLVRTTDWLEVRQIGDGTWAIDDRGSDVMYLVAGDEECLLIDTGWGVGDLLGLVASLSPLPLTVVNSHGHPDHTFGNGAFEEVYIHDADEPFVRTPRPIETRQRIAENILPRPLPMDFDVNTWAASAAGSLVPIKDGHVFDLGNRILEVLSVPGHTPGSVCLLDRGTRLLFTGDTVLSGTLWLQLEESLPLRQFHGNLQRLQTFAGEFEHILPGHGDLEVLPLSKDVLDDLVTGVAAILAGELVGRGEKTFAGNGLRCDFGTCGVLYRPDRLE